MNCSDYKISAKGKSTKKTKQNPKKHKTILEGSRVLQIIFFQFRISLYFFL